MTHFGPFLLFDGNCAEAMEFYRSCLGGELSRTRLGETPMKAQFPPEQHGRVVFAQLKSGVFEINAADWMHPTRKPRRGNMVGLYISDAPYAELEKHFERLSAGADPELMDKLTGLPFGTYGHLRDKYGVHWFFQGEKKSK